MKRAPVAHTDATTLPEGGDFLEGGIPHEAEAREAVRQEYSEPLRRAGPNLKGREHPPPQLII